MATVFLLQSGYNHSDFRGSSNCLGHLRVFFACRKDRSVLLQLCLAVIVWVCWCVCVCVCPSHRVVSCVGFSHIHTHGCLVSVQSGMLPMRLRVHTEFSCTRTANRSQLLIEQVSRLSMHLLYACCFVCFVCSALVPCHIDQQALTVHRLFAVESDVNLEVGCLSRSE